MFVYAIHKFFVSGTGQHVAPRLCILSQNVCKILKRRPPNDDRELGREGYLISSVTAGYLCRKDHQWRAMQLGNFAQETSRFLHWKQQTREREGICEFKLSTVI